MSVNIEANVVLAKLAELKGYARHSEELRTIERAMALIGELMRRLIEELERRAGWVPPPTFLIADEETEHTRAESATTALKPRREKRAAKAETEA